MQKQHIGILTLPYFREHEVQRSSAERSERHFCRGDRKARHFAIDARSDKATDRPGAGIPGDTDRADGPGRLWRADLSRPEGSRFIHGQRAVGRNQVARV